LCWGIALLGISLLLTARVGQAADENGGGLDPKAIDKIVYTSLRDVINRGADIYNRGDHAGCYRLYEGGLRAAEPFLKHRPKLQQVIKDSFVRAQREPLTWRRAFVLREVLDKVRADVRPKAQDDLDKKDTKKDDLDKKDDKKDPKKDDDDKKDDKKDPKKDPKKDDDDKKDPKKDPKKDDDDKDNKKDPKKDDDRTAFSADQESREKKSEKTGKVTGTVTYKGEPLPVGEIALHSAGGKVFKGLLDEAGKYVLIGVKPGEYKVTIDVSKAGKKGAKRVVVVIPAKYKDAKTSGLTYKVVAGNQTYDIVLND
jgi:hypothetical protein